jgi:hypothetical protein
MIASQLVRVSQQNIDTLIKKSIIINHMALTARQRVFFLPVHTLMVQ